jgi:hypothetical protein
MLPKGIKKCLLTVSRELSKYKLDLVGMQKVRWEDGGAEPAGEYAFVQIGE